MSAITRSASPSTTTSPPRPAPSFEVMRVLAEADRVYWRLYAARRDLELRQAEYELARQQLERATGAKPLRERSPTSRSSAPSPASLTVSRRSSPPNNTLRDRQRDLKRTVNSPDLPVGGATLIVPDSKPLTVYYPRLDAERLVDAALAGRMEMLELELQIARDTANVRIARNSALPLVTLDYKLQHQTASAPPGPARIASPPTRTSRTTASACGSRSPIGNEAAKSRLRPRDPLAPANPRHPRAADPADPPRSPHGRRRHRVELATHPRQPAARRSRPAGRSTSRPGSFNLGLRTSTDVLDAQTRLADAQSSEISAVTEYQISSDRPRLRNRNAAGGGECSMGLAGEICAVRGKAARALYPSPRYSGERMGEGLARLMLQFQQALASQYGAS